MYKLVIVESPAKARTIGGYLGRGYVVESSIGHIRDLPQTAADIPASIKGEPWARLGVDVDHGFKPVYVVSRSKEAHISKLKSLLKDADELYLATDEDREGEAIAWHLLDELKPGANLPVKRMVFHEITPQAIRAAVENPREIDMDLVEAQEARRILDRLYGYEVSPVLWKKVMSGLSAGRVQSVATRLVVDRERERMAFRAASYWDLEGTFDAGAEHEQRMFKATLNSIDEVRVARGSDFDDNGSPKPNAQVARVDQARAEALVEALHDTAFTVRSVESKPYTRKPYAPFRTTTLQQEASRKLGFSASSTMSVAQRLYENGHITYMRTDSTTLSDTALNAARTQARELYGEEYVPDAPRVYASKVKNAQEAHEAIRPAGDQFRTPAEAGLTGDQFRLYELIWMRTIASQMKDAVGNSLTIRLGGQSAGGEDVVFSSSGRTITFHGFLKAYVESTDDADATRDDQESRLPNLAEGAIVTAANLRASGHETKPPARYTEASLISELEKREIGRPSTYASIIGTILNRGYVYKKGTALVPAWLAFSVIRLLERHFERLVSYEFTARMEDVLDDIAGGRKDLQTELAEFYFGGGNVEGLKKLVTELGDIDAKELANFPVHEADGRPSGIDLIVGRYGPYVEKVEHVIGGVPARANVPEDLPPDELTADLARQLLADPDGVEKELGYDPATGLMVVVRNGRYGPYVTEVLPEDGPKSQKPRTGSLFKDMSLDTITLEQALRLLSLPRVVGTDPGSGEEITAQNGRYGPYLKKGTDSRSLETEQQLFDITLEQALAIYAQPKTGGRWAAVAPLKALGTDPVSGQPVVVKAGRFGEYVTDGEYNAPLRKDDSVDAITLERAAELLAERRRKLPAKKAAAPALPERQIHGTPESIAQPEEPDARSLEPTTLTAVELPLAAAEQLIRNGHKGLLYLGARGPLPQTSPALGSGILYVLHRDLVAVDVVVADSLAAAVRHLTDPATGGEMSRRAAYWAPGQRQAVVRESPALQVLTSAARVARPTWVRSEADWARIGPGAGVYRIRILSAEGDRADRIYIGRTSDFRRRPRQHNKIPKDDYGRQLWGVPNGIQRIELIYAKVDGQPGAWSSVDLDALEERHIDRARKRHQDDPENEPAVLNFTVGRNGPPSAAGRPHWFRWEPAD